MTERDLSRAEWRKSSYSSQDGTAWKGPATCPGQWIFATPKNRTGDAVGLAGDTADRHWQVCIY